jgi:hypothetical protein
VVSRVRKTRRELWPEMDSWREVDDEQCERLESVVEERCFRRVRFSVLAKKHSAPVVVNA